MLVLRNKKDRGVVGVKSKAEQKSLEPGLANDFERGLADWLDGFDWRSKASAGNCPHKATITELAEGARA